MTTDAESAIRRAHRLDQMGKLALLAGLVLPIAVAIWLMQQGFGARENCSSSVSGVLSGCFSCSRPPVSGCSRVPVPAKSLRAGVRT